MASIALATETIGRVTVVRVSGSLDSTSATLLLAQVGPVLEHSEFMVLNLAAVDYVSSAGWGMVLHAFSPSAESRPSVALCGMSPQARKSFELLKLNTVFRHFRDEGEAVKSFL